MPSLQTGIYRHYKNGQLYFVSGIREDHETGDFWVSYDPLYPDEPFGFTQKLSRFNAMVSDSMGKSVSRFVLIQPHSVEIMRMILPNTKVTFSYWFAVRKRSRVGSHQVNRVFMAGEEVMVEYSLISNRQVVESLEIFKFLERFERRES